MMIDAELKRLVRQSGIPLRRLAARAGVSYWPLQRWMQGTQVSYSVVSADAIHRVLTGRRMLACGCKAKGRAKR